MKNKVAKGHRVENLCADELKAKSYLIWKTLRVKYQNIDVFGLFDVMALHPQGEHILFIQVKSNRADNETRAKVKKLKLPSSCQKWIWIRKDYRFWVKEFYE